MDDNKRAWIYTVLILALMTCLAFTFGCKAAEQAQQPYTLTLPDSVKLPDTVNGWQVVRTGVNQYTYFPPVPAPKRVKYKNVGNTITKDSHNAKAKGDGIIGNGNAPIEAKKQAVVGDGNTVEMKKAGGPPWWVVMLIGVAFGIFLRSFFRI